jgi:hypothetical protein
MVLMEKVSLWGRPGVATYLTKLICARPALWQVIRLKIVSVVLVKIRLQMMLCAVNQGRLKVVIVRALIQKVRIVTEIVRALIQNVRILNQKVRTVAVHTGVATYPIPPICALLALWQMIRLKIAAAVLVQTPLKMMLCAVNQLVVASLTNPACVRLGAWPIVGPHAQPTPAFRIQRMMLNAVCLHVTPTILQTCVHPASWQMINLEHVQATLASTARPTMLLAAYHKPNATVCLIHPTCASLAGWKTIKANLSVLAILASTTWLTTPFAAKIQPLAIMAW